MTVQHDQENTQRIDTDLTRSASSRWMPYTNRFRLRSEITETTAKSGDYWSN